jgi:dimeric dUTPase (all-alpha-NTP-PPase superfamily)
MADECNDMIELLQHSEALNEALKALALNSPRPRLKNRILCWKYWKKKVLEEKSTKRSFLNNPAVRGRGGPP